MHGKEGEKERFMRESPRDRRRRESAQPRKSVEGLLFSERAGKGDR